MKKLIRDTSAQGGVAGFFIGAMIAVIIALQVAWPVIDTSIYGGEATSSGTITFSGNVSNGELVNLTWGDAVYRFEFNTTALGADCQTANCIRVNVTAFTNTSDGAATNLTTAINANASTAALVTATHSTNRTTVTADAIGRQYNLLATAENAANAAWGAETLTGGSNGTTANMSTSATTLVDQIPLFLVLVLLMVFIKAVM